LACCNFAKKGDFASSLLLRDLRKPIKQESLLKNKMLKTTNCQFRITLPINRAKDVKRSLWYVTEFLENLTSTIL